MFGGIGVNVISNLRQSHRVEAEKRFMEEHIDVV